jgi:hypothetical protein
VKFAHPLAASRRAVTGEPDERLIALAFQRVSLRKLHDTADGSVDGPLLDDRDGGVSEIAEPNEAPTAPVTLEGHVDGYAYHAPTRVGGLSAGRRKAGPMIASRPSRRISTTATKRARLSRASTIGPGCKGAEKVSLLRCAASPGKCGSTKAA